MPTILKTKNSVTTTVVPTTLQQGELAVNITDKKMWVGNAATTPVQILGAGTTGTAAGSNTQVQYNSSGTLAGDADFTFNGTTVTMTNDASISGLTVGKGGGAVASNTTVGFQAGLSNTTGGGNTFLGQYAGYPVTTGSQNTFLGQAAGNGTAVTGDSNTGVGANSLALITGAATSNTALGRFALYSNTTASNNTAVGYQAMYSNATGTLNTAIGVQSLYSATGNNSTALGYYAARQTTTGNVTAIGGYALYLNTTGTSNIAVGHNDGGVAAALQSNTTGSYNVAVGTGALKDNTTADNNTAVGYQAGYSVTTGNRNTFLGVLSGFSQTGNFNTFLGARSGINSTGSRNTFVGAVGEISGVANYGCGEVMTTGSNNTIIGGFNGNQNSLDIRTASNYIVLSDGLGNPRGVFNPSGYFKASNDGTYVSVTGTYHEFRNTASDPAIYVTATNASFGSNAQIIDVTRAATSGYNFGLFRSSAGGDNEFVFRGDGNGYADGTWNNNGADYAEYFESATGQEIPVGSTVVLENNKVRLATVSDNQADVIGVVRPKEPSKASMVVGNTAWNKWANKYLTDDFDRYIMENHDVVEWTDADGKKHSYESHNIPSNIVVPTDAVRKSYEENGKKFQHYKLNPAWNPNAEYINRENRDEWLIIGLVGQVKVSKGQIIGERWKKMRDVSASVEEWFIR